MTLVKVSVSLDSGISTSSGHAISTEITMTISLIRYFFAFNSYAYCLSRRNELILLTLAYSMTVALEYDPPLVSDYYEMVLLMTKANDDY